jgi:hypothetical protein
MKNARAKLPQSSGLPRRKESRNGAVKRRLAGGKGWWWLTSAHGEKLQKGGGSFSRWLAPFIGGGDRGCHSGPTRRRPVACRSGWTASAQRRARVPYPRDAAVWASVGV